MSDKISIYSILVSHLASSNIHKMKTIAEININ